MAIIRCLPSQSEPTAPLNLPPFTPDTALLIPFCCIRLLFYKASNSGFCFSIPKLAGKRLNKLEV